MKFDSRIGWWLFGCFVGFVIGYIVRSLRRIEERVEEVDEHVTQQGRHDTEAGLLDRKLLNNVALFLVILVTVWAALSSQKSSNKVEGAQDQLARVTSCTQTYLTKTIAALNVRTSDSTEQNMAVRDLQKAQSEFLSIFILKKPPATAEAFNAALTKYVNALTNFLKLSGRSSDTIMKNPYPTIDEFKNCLKKPKGK